MTTTWLGVWTRAVIGPAYRRAAAVWAGCAIVGAIVFGPTGMHPRDLTRLALHAPAATIILGGTWLLVFAPIARGLLHADEARYLRSLPSPSITTHVVRVLALVGLQAPWLLLWLVGERARGLAIFAASTVVLVAIAWWRPSRRARGAPRWRSATRALVGMYTAALTRRAGDALVRGAGLAILAGLAGALFVRNNAFTGEHAARIAASVIALMSVPAQVGVLGVLLDAHRRSTWLALSLGIAPSTRAVSLGIALAVVHVAAAFLAIASASIVLVTMPALESVPSSTIASVSSSTIVPASPSTIAWIAAICLACAIASSIGTARMILSAQSSPNASIHMAIGSLAVAVATIAALTLFGAIAGAIAIIVATSFALAARTDRSSS